MKVNSEKDLLELALDAAWEKEDPRLAWMLSSLAGVSSVKFSDEVDTACIKKSGEKYMIRFSRNFVQKYLDTPDDVLFVLLHEIMHKVQGDPIRDMDLRNRVDLAVANMVEDIVINARLCKMFFPGSLPMFDKLYARELFPDVLMITPVNLCREKKDSGFALWEYKWNFECPEPKGKSSPPAVSTFKQKLLDALKLVRNLPPLDEDLVWKFNSAMTDEKALSRWYIRAWFRNKEVTVEQLYEWIRPLFPEAPEVILLGDHGDKSGGMDGWGDVLGEYGAGYSEDEKDDEIDVEVQHKHVNKMIRMIRRAVEPDPMNPLESFMVQPERSMVPWPGRRENLWLALGLWPVFWKPPVYTRDLDYLQPHLYLDVSGSTEENQPMIYGLVYHLADLIGDPIYMFSNTVAEAGIEDIRSGRVRTTGGTDFDCVIEHATQNRFRKIILITDGYADMNDKNRKRVSSGELEIYLVLTEQPHRHLPDVLANHARQTFVLS